MWELERKVIKAQIDTTNGIDRLRLMHLREVGWGILDASFVRRIIADLAERLGLCPEKAGRLTVAEAVAHLSPPESRTDRPARSPADPSPSGTAAPSDPTEGDRSGPPAGPDRTHRERRQAAPRTAARRRGGNKTPEAPAELPELVNLNQAAALVNKTAHGLRHYRNKGMPKPFIRGTKGQPNQYLWSEMRLWLARQFNRPIPEVSILKFRSSGR
jgi:hypothetical protein